MVITTTTASAAARPLARLRPRHRHRSCGRRCRQRSSRQQLDRSTLRRCNLACGAHTSDARGESGESWLRPQRAHPCTQPKRSRSPEDDLCTRDIGAITSCSCGGGLSSGAAACVTVGGSPPARGRWRRWLSCWPRTTHGAGCAPRAARGVASSWPSTAASLIVGHAGGSDLFVHVLCERLRTRAAGHPRPLTPS